MGPAKILALAAAMAAAQSHADDACPWHDPAKPPELTQEGGRVAFRYRLDAEWFRCAKRAGGMLTLRVLTGRDGKMTLWQMREARSYSVTEGVGTNRLCDQDPAPTHVQVELAGTGAMAQVTYKSEPLEIFCARCPFRGADNMLALIPRRGKATLVGSMDPEWHRCARSGSTLVMQFFTGETAKEVREATAPVFSVKSLERSPRFKKTVSLRKLCKGKPRYVGYEYLGTGEMRAMNGQGRAIQGIRCK
jgi:hypothetical protein